MKNLRKFGAQLALNCQFSPNHDFMGNVTLMIFPYLWCPIMLQSVEKALYQDPMILYLILSHNRAKIAHLAQKIVFWETFLQ